VIVVLRSTFDASNARAWGEYALEETKALEVWRSDAFADRSLAIAEMRATASIADPRALPLWHIVYSYAPDEPIVLDAARAHLEQFHDTLTGEYQDRTARRPTLLWMAAPHGDAHCRHVHEMLLTIDADTGERLIPPGQNVRLFHEFSRRNTMLPLLGRLDATQAVVGRKRDGEVWNGQMSFARWLRELVADGKDWADHDGRLAAFGIRREDRRKTFVYVDGTTDKVVAVAASAVLTPDEQRALGARPPFIVRGSQVYPAYGERANSIELIEPTLPGGAAAYGRWRLLRDAGYPVGRLGEFARRKDDPAMMAYDDPRSRQAARRPPVGRGGRPLLVVTSAGRALKGVRAANGKRVFRALDGNASARVDSLDQLDLTRARRVLVEDLGEIQRRLIADVDNRVLVFTAEDHEVQKKSVDAAELTEILSGRLSANRDIMNRSATDDPRFEVAETKVDLIKAILPRLARVPEGQRFTVIVSDENKVEIDGAYLVALQALLPPAPEQTHESVRSDQQQQPREVSALVGNTWKSVYDALASEKGKGVMYGVYVNGSGERVGAMFDVWDGRLQFLGDSREMGYDNVDIQSLEMKLGPIVAPGHPEAAMSLVQRGKSAAELESTLTEQFQDAYERRTRMRDVRATENDLKIGESAFAQNTIGSPDTRQRTNSLGSPDSRTAGREHHPLIARLKADYPIWLLQQGEMEPATEQIVERYEAARARAFRKMEKLRDLGDEREGKPVKQRAEELDGLKTLGLIQEETTISLGLAQSNQFLRPTLRRFVEVYDGIDEGERAQALQLLSDDVELDQTEQVFRYDGSLRAAINTEVEDLGNSRLAYIQTDRPERTRFYEQEDRFYMRRAPSGDDIDVALRMAEARWGSVDITGDDKFVERALRRAVDLGIEVSTERHQKRVEELRKEIAAERAADVTREQPNITLPTWAQPIASDLKRGGPGQTVLRDIITMPRYAWELYTEPWRTKPPEPAATNVRAYEDARLAELVQRSVFGQGAAIVTTPQGIDAKARTPDGIVDGTLLGAVNTGSRTVALVGVPNPDREGSNVVLTDLPASADARRIEGFRDRQISIQVDEKGDAEVYLGQLGTERRARSETSRSR
jgi:hypothetical protein